MEETWELAVMKNEGFFLKSAILCGTLFFLSACSESTISTISAERYFKTKTEVRASLPYDQKVKLDSAMRRLVLNHKVEGEAIIIKFSASQIDEMGADKLLSLNADIFDEMSAQEVISADQNLENTPFYMAEDTFDKLLDEARSNHREFGGDYEITQNGRVATLETLLFNAKDFVQRQDKTYTVLDLK